MFNLLNELRKATDKMKGKILGWTISYMVAKIVGLIEEASSVKGLWGMMPVLLDVKKPTNILLWLSCILAILMYVCNWIVRAIMRRQNPTTRFRKVMKIHSAEEIQDVCNKTYAWGYNYCIHYSRDPKGWSPRVFLIGEYDDTKYRFAEKTDFLPGYCRDGFNSYQENNTKVDAIIRKNEDRVRYSACHIKCNLNRASSKIDVKIKKTTWVQLQYSWDYFRLLHANTNKKIEGKDNEQEIIAALHRAFERQGESFYINSFCLHLIIETKKGVVLSRISQTKENDYASTWAATIGEQLEERDFYREGNDGNGFYEDFVERWTKRALEEEFGIDAETDYEDVVEPDSLKVLSVDMEADIYNVALTCVIKMNMSLEEFLNNYTIDRLENYELRECTVDEIREILLGYPENQGQYHPSTYLRLLMYHRYKLGTGGTNKLLCKDDMKSRKR